MTNRFTVAELRERAQEVLAAVHITDIRLKGLVCDSSDVVLPGPFDVETDISFKGELRERRAVECWVRYAIEAQSVANDEPTQAWHVQLELIATFSRDDESEGLPEYTKDELEAFAFALGVMHVHPYARETVQSVTSRLGYPPFTLDGIHPPTALPDDEEIELESPESPSRG